MGERLDHGLLNIPFAKRGVNIDAEIDALKADLAREGRRARAERFRMVKQQRARVRELLARIGDYRVVQLAAPMGKFKPNGARRALCTAATANLTLWIAALETERFPPGGCAACWAPLGKCDHTEDEWLGPA